MGVLIKNGETTAGKIYQRIWQRYLPVLQNGLTQNKNTADDLYQEKVLVQDAVNRLPEKLRIVVLLYYMENLKVAEIAEQMHESVSSIKSKLMRARKYLRKELEDSVL